MKDIKGKRFGMLVALEHGKFDHRLIKGWLCICDCGVERRVETHKLVSGKQKSCGCKAVAKPTHGHRKTRVYRIWGGMIERCTSPTNKSFADYGARGISVCDAWLSFECFLKDMGYPPDGYSIERTNNDQGYGPGNCIWAPPITQARNKRNVRKIEHNGLLMTIPEWAERTGLKASTIHSRLSNGWSPERAVSSA